MTPVMAAFEDFLVQRAAAFLPVLGRLDAGGGRTGDDAGPA